jgi:hypothetical protein
MTSDQGLQESRPRALVIYESMFGNTKSVAQAVALGLAATFEVELTEVDDAPSELPKGLALLVVGGPTHAFGLSREGTRDDARRQLPAGQAAPSSTGIREWLETLPHAPKDAPMEGPLTAAFDTKVSHPNLPGSAAHAAARRLRRLGYLEAVPPRTFHVEGTSGPLATGEHDAAFSWGSDLATTASSATWSPTA